MGLRLCRRPLLAWSIESHGHCALRCCDEAEDSIEHYCRCSFTLGLAKRCGVEVEEIDMETFLCLNKRQDDAIIIMARIGYAMFRTTNLYRGREDFTGQQVWDALEQFYKDAR